MSPSTTNPLYWVPQVRNSRTHELHALYPLIAGQSMTLIIPTYHVRHNITSYLHEPSAKMRAPPPICTCKQHSRCQLSSCRSVMNTCACSISPYLGIVEHMSRSTTDLLHRSGTADPCAIYPFPCRSTCTIRNSRTHEP